MLLTCPICGARHETPRGLRHHHLLVEPNVNGEFAPFYLVRDFSPNGEWRASEYERVYGDENFSFDMRDALNESEPIIRKILDSFNHRVRVNIKVEARMIKNLSAEEVDFVDQFFSTPSQILTEINDFPRLYTTSIEILSDQLETFQANGSGWTLFLILRVILTVSSYLPRTFGCFNSLPSELKIKRCSLTNIKDNQERCFKLAVLASCFPVKASHKHPNRPSQYLKHEDKFWFPSRYPVSLSDIKTFCKRNHNVALTLIEYETESKCFFPLRCDQSNKEFKIILLAVNNHFYPVRNVNALLRPSNYHYGSDSQVVFCLNCLNSFHSQKSLDNHVAICGEKKEARLVMPSPENAVVRFNGGPRTIIAPYFITLDTESILIKCDDDDDIEQRHEISSYCIALVRSGDSKLINLYSGFGEGCATKLVDSIEDAVKYANENIPNVPINISSLTDFNNATVCGHCNEQFVNGNKVRHHDHSTGEYLDALCNNCNLKAKPSKQVPILVHNLTYDIASFIRELHRLVEARKPPFVIAPTCERIRYLAFDSVAFIDTTQYVPASLEKLVSEHAKSGESFPCLDQYFKQNSNLLKRKGVFPYSFIDSWDAYEHSGLPPINFFKNDLTEEECSQEDYNYALEVYSKFNCKSLKDYSNIYLKTDVLLLADIMIGFRKVLYNQYQLDLFRFISLPQFSWNAALKFTKVKIDLFTDPDMYLFIENSVRGGLCQQSVKHVRANNSACPDYNPSEPESHILYVCANNLYGFAMSQKLPLRNFRWVDVQSIEIINHPIDDPEGYIVEVDLECPPEIHDNIRDLPLTANHSYVQKEDMSEYHRNLAESLRVKVGKTPKLLLTCKSQSRYIVHYTLLQLFIKLGYKITQIHRAIKFSQEAFLAPYIANNNNQRTIASSSIAKNMFKLLNNSIYGRTLYNHRNTKNFKLVYDTVGFDRNAKKLTCKSVKLLGSNVALFHHVKNEVNAMFPCVIGSAILDISKHHMFHSYYFGFKKYINNLTLCYMDTDSFVLFSKSQNFFNELKTLKLSLLDTSNLPIGHPLSYPPHNQGTLGMFKDESAGDPITEAIFLRPKAYSLVTSSGKNIKRAKGTSKCVVKQRLNHERYRDVLQGSIEIYETFRRIQPRNFTNFTIEQRKKALSAFCDKRHQLDEIRSVPYGFLGSSPPETSFYTR